MIPSGEYFLVFAAGWAAHAIVRAELGESDDRDGVARFLDEREADLREQYSTTDMDYVEFGDRIVVIEDPDTERIMREAVAVDGVGPETAFELAHVFPDYDAFADASREQLESVNGIGENRATALLRR